jgi:hypothetical protein
MAGPGGSREAGWPEAEASPGGSTWGLVPPASTWPPTALASAVLGGAAVPMGVRPSYLTQRSKALLEEQAAQVTVGRVGALCVVLSGWRPMHAMDSVCCGGLYACEVVAVCAPAWFWLVIVMGSRGVSVGMSVYAAGIVVCTPTSPWCRPATAQRSWSD